MPGLRSLIARRRCSLPVQSIISSQNLDSYSTVVNAISLNKNSFDNCHSTSFKESSNTYSDNNICAGSERKWDLHSLFQSNNFSNADQSSNFQFANQATDNYVALPKNENVVVPEEIDKENISINATANEENVYNTYVKSQCMEPSIDMSHSNDYSAPIIETSPERIVIKMKLLHHNSLSEMANIPSDSSECPVEEAVDLESKSSNLTRWMIDSILKEPVVETVNNGELCIAKESKSSLESVQFNEIDTNTINCESLDCLNVKFEKKSDEHCCEPLIRKQEEKQSDFEKLNELDLIEQKIPQFGIHVRRPSDSERSEDSFSSDVSANSSSSSSIKSCSIVIKRIDNSGMYGCFQSPKSKKKKCINNDHEANGISCNKNLINIFPNFEMTSLPCSVILCDIFQDLLKSKRDCSFCFNVYDMKSCLSVDIGSNTISFQCNKCDWLNIYKLIPRDVQISPVH